MKSGPSLRSTARHEAKLRDVIMGWFVESGEWAL